MSLPNPTDIAELEANPHLRVLRQAGLSMIYLIYNQRSKPLKDVRVRRALDMAIDKKAIIATVFEDRAQVAVAPIPPLQWPYDKSMKDAPRDLEKAKAWLAQAGYPKGFVISLWYSPGRLNPNAQLMAEMIQADWKKIGVIVKIETREWGEFLKSAFNGEHDTLLIGNLGDTGDPNDWLGTISCLPVGRSFSNWCSKPFSELVQKAVHSIDRQERTQLYLRAQKIFKREQPYTPIAYPFIYQSINKNVTGFKINPFSPTIFYGVSLK